jgi:hypothetical protein
MKTHLPPTVSGNQGSALHLFASKQLALNVFIRRLALPSVGSSAIRQLCSVGRFRDLPILRQDILDVVVEP